MAKKKKRNNNLFKSFFKPKAEKVKADKIEEAVDEGNDNADEVKKVIDDIKDKNLTKGKINIVTEEVSKDTAKNVDYSIMNFIEINNPDDPFIFILYAENKDEDNNIFGSYLVNEGKIKPIKYIRGFRKYSVYNLDAMQIKREDKERFIIFLNAAIDNYTLVDPMFQSQKTEMFKSFTNEAMGISEDII